VDNLRKSQNVKMGQVVNKSTSAVSGRQLETQGQTTLKQR